MRSYLITGLVVGAGIAFGAFLRWVDGWDADDNS